MNIIETVDLTKYYGDFCANDGISLTLKEREILAIVGENGAGKTTLMNMLYGLIQPSSGKILMRGEEIELQSPRNAIALGLGMVHQHFKLLPSLTVYENILLGAEIKKGKSPFIDFKEEKRQIRELIDRYQFNIDVDVRIRDLSVGEMQRVEILKMLYREVDILILDEPTAVLTPQEIDALFVTLKELKKIGKSIVIITHKLQEVMDVSDRVTIIRGGQHVATVNTADTNVRQLAQMMVGGDAEFSVTNKHTHEPGKIIYEVKNLTTDNKLGKEVVSDVSFSIREGEILGVAGVEGNGQSELVKLLTGLMIPTKGQVLFNDIDITNAWPRELRERGIGIIPEDRYAEGLCRTMTLTENVICGYHYAPDVSKKSGLLRVVRCRDKRDELIENYDIRVADANGTIDQLSGGNAQKVIVGRELDRQPSFIIASQPTRGVDISSTKFIHNQFLEKKCENTAVLLVSSDLNELMTISDRIVVMYKGKLIGELHCSEFDREKLGLLMAGIISAPKDNEEAS